SVYRHKQFNYVPVFKMHTKLKYLRFLLRLEKKKIIRNTKVVFLYLKNFKTSKQRVLSDGTLVSKNFFKQSSSVVDRTRFLQFPQKKFPVFPMFSYNK